MSKDDHTYWSKQPTRASVLERVEIKRQSQKQVVVYDSNKDSMEHLSASSTSDGKCDCTDDIEGLKQHYEDLSEKYDSLNITVILLQDKKLSYFEDRVVELTKHSMKDNIVVSGVPERRPTGNHSETELISFVNRNLDIQLGPADIKRAHRMGPRKLDDKGQVATHRPLVAKLGEKIKDSVMGNVRKLKGKKGPDGKAVFLCTQEPEAITEKRKQLNYRFRQIKKRYHDDKPEGSKAEVTIRGDDVYVNNNLMKRKVQVPSVEDVINIPPDERKQLRRMSIKRTDNFTEKGSVFYAYSKKVNCFADVRSAYRKLKLQDAHADDIMCAFSVKDEFNVQVQEMMDDREHGASPRILSAIQKGNHTNVAVFVVRLFDGKHIGGKRFQCITDAAEAALKLL